MKFNFRHLFFLVVLLAFSACSKDGCIQKSKYKQKNYKIKKLKAYQRGAGIGTSSSSAPAQAKKKPEVVVEEEEQLTIAETKIGAPPEVNVEKKVEFKGEEIEITEDGYQYDEQILFVNSTDLFSNPKEARDQLKDLSRLLKKEKDLKVTIIGNTATSSPQKGVIYGDSKAALDQEVTLNTKDASIRDSMNARAKRVYKLLVDGGVNPNQLDYTTGTHGRTRKERVVSFRIKTK